jgi:hypothetical protein
MEERVKTEFPLNTNTSQMYTLNVYILTHNLLKVIH